MNTYEIAQTINNIEYAENIPKEILKDAKENKIVIVMGYSDDVVLFQGAIDDEISFSKNPILLDKEGLLGEFDQLNKDSKEDLRNYFKREDGANKIQAYWDDNGVYGFTYQTEIQHEKFNVKDGDGFYCQGIVFCLNDLA